MSSFNKCQLPFAISGPRSDLRPSAAGDDSIASSIILLIAQKFEKTKRNESLDTRRGRFSVKMLRIAKKPVNHVRCVVSDVRFRVRRKNGAQRLETDSDCLRGVDDVASA